MDFKKVFFLSIMLTYTVTGLAQTGTSSDFVGVYKGGDKYNNYTFKISIENDGVPGVPPTQILILDGGYSAYQGRYIKSQQADQYYLDQPSNYGDVSVKFIREAGLVSKMEVSYSKEGKVFPDQIFLAKKIWGEAPRDLNSWISNFKIKENGLLDQFDPAFNHGQTDYPEFLIYTKPNNKKILIDSKTKEKIVNQEFDFIKSIGFNTIEVGLNYTNGQGQILIKYGIIDTKGNTILPIDYSDITPYPFGELLEPQFFKCRKIGKMINSSDTQIYVAIINRQGKILTSSTGLNKDINLTFFVNNGKPHVIYEYGGTTSTTIFARTSEFSICQINDIPTTRFPGFIVISWINSLSHKGNLFKNMYESHLKEIHPLIIPTVTYKKVPGTPVDERQIRLFDLSNLKFISSIPVFYDLGNWETKLGLIIQNKFGHESIVSKGLNLLMPFIPYNMKSTSDSNIFHINKIQKPGVGLYKFGFGIILPANYKYIEELSNKYWLIENFDNTFNVFDITNKRMFLNKNFDKIGVKKSSTNDLIDFSNNNKFTDFVDCMFEGKIERFQLPK